MRFGLVHRIMTNALAALGVLALVASGQFNDWVSGIIVAGLIGALLVKESWQRLPALRHLDSIALLAIVAIQIARFVMGASLLDVLIEFAAALQIIRLATRKGAAHDQQVIVLALLHLIAGTVLGGGLAYGLCFLGVLIVAPGALVLSHLRREVEGNYRQGARDRTGLPVDVPRILRSRRVVGKTFLGVTCLLSVPIFAFTAALFVIFPRVGLSLLLLNRGQSGRMIGFSGRVDLGEVGVLRSDPAIAMRVEVPDLPEPPPRRLTLHLRGTALDSYDGRAWSQTLVLRRPLGARGELVPVEGAYPKPDEDSVMKIDLEPIDPPVVFLPPNTAGLRFRSSGQLVADGRMTALLGPEGEYRYQPIDDRGLKYEVFLSDPKTPTFEQLPRSDRSRYLSIPSKLPDRIGDLAHDWTDGLPTDLAKAQAIEKRLREEYRYDLESPSGGYEQPLDHFLFESKRGHCEFYSTAMAMMLRHVGVPSRNVTGFIGGTYNRFGGFYVVRQGDAHSWVEAYIDGRGWITFDPTPPADSAPRAELTGFWAYLRDIVEATSQRWDRHVVGYDLEQQVTLFNSLTNRYKSRTNAVDRRMSRRTIILLVGGALLVLGGVGYWWMRRRKRPPKESEPGRKPLSRSATLATSLYESLEGAMTIVGISRSPGTPPLKHAEALVRAKHPLGDEVLSLTEIYIDARFGHMELSEKEKSTFEDRVRGIRRDGQQHKRQAAAAAR